MNLSLLLQGLSRITTTIGHQEEIIRLAPDTRLPTECRKVSIAYAPVTVRRVSMLPWIRDQVVESLAITATIRRKDGRTYVVSKLLGVSMNRAIEVVMLEVVKKATLDELQQLRKPVAPRPLRMG